MSLRIAGLASAVCGLLAVPTAMAIGDDLIDSEQCDLQMSSIYGEYSAPKSLNSQSMQIIKRGEQRAVDQADLHQWLSVNQPSLQDAKSFRIELTRSEKVAIGEETCTDCYELQIDQRRYQIGVARDMGTRIAFEDLLHRQLPKSGSWRQAGGTMTRGADGELVWTAVVESPGATALRIGLTNFKLPEGAELYVYNDHGQAFGPYKEWGPNDTGMFTTNATVGSKAYLQLHHYGPVADLADLAFEISDIGHIGPRFQLAKRMVPEAFGEKAFCSFNADCIENVNCTSDPAVSDARSAVAEMVYRSGGGYYICSGGLLADSDNSSVIPYFLTANHCISKGNEASSLEAYFDFEVPCNSGACPRYGDGAPVTTNGATIVASNRTSDFTLLQLAQTPGGSRAYLGWTNGEIAFSNGASLHRVSHPSGAPQAYSEHVVDTSKGTCTTWPRGNWIYSRDITGATEGGSSGSPVVNGGGQVVGQLSGGCGTNVNEECDADNNATVDGAFAAYWSQVQPFLGDGGSGEPPPGSCNDLPSGASCTSNSECCSGNCKGKPGARTCK